MNIYMDLMRSAINYIEDNIEDNITLTGISGRFNLSEYHFDRLFKAVVGKNLKQYILGRKLTTAVGRLKTTDDSIIDVAMDLGFEYPEVFSRAFKKQFGISPRDYRTCNPEIKVVEKADVVPRNIINFMGGVTLKACYSHFEPIKLLGVAVDVDVIDSDYGDKLKTESNKFLLESSNFPGLDHEKYYSAVNCHGGAETMYTVFSGKRIIKDVPACNFEQRTLPGGWYAGFAYHGDMIEIRSTFEEDLFRWIAIKEIELNSNGVGMISVYNKDYDETQDVDIFVPVKSPK